MLFYSVCFDFPNNMDQSIIDLNNVEVQSQYRSYHSLIEDTEFRVDRFCFQEDENGMKMLMFFEDERYFVKLPKKFRKHYRGCKEELDILNKKAIQGEISFKFKGWDEEGNAVFKFGSPGRIN